MSQTLHAEPGPIAFEIGRTALVIIDMQRDFLEPGGFGETLGNDVTPAAGRGRALRRRAGRRADGGDAGHPHPRGPPARPRRRAAGQDGARRAVEADRRPRPDGPHPRPRRARARHRRRALSGRGRAGDRQAGQGRLPPDRPRAGAEEQRHRHAAGLRRDHGSLRAYHDPGRQRPRLSLRRDRGRLRLATSRNSTASASR